MSALARLALLLAAVGALLLVPATAQAEGPFYYNEFEEKVGGPGESVYEEGEGEISITDGPYTFGSCPANVTMQIWNGEEGAEGYVEELAVSTPCAPPGPPPPCNPLSVKNNAPWKYEITGEEGETSVFGMTLTLKFAPMCMAFGIPELVRYEGTGTAVMEVNPKTGKACINAEETGDLINEATKGKVLLSWTYCLPGFWV